jgi:hypothetical protein
MTPEWTKNSAPVSQPLKGAPGGKPGWPAAPKPFLPPASQVKTRFTPTLNKNPSLATPAVQPKLPPPQKVGSAAQTKIESPAGLLPPKFPALPPKPFLPPAVQVKKPLIPAQNKTPLVATSTLQPNVALPHRPGSLANPRVFSPPAIQLSESKKKSKGTKMTLGAFYAQTPPPKAWAPGAPLVAAIVAAGPAPAPPAPPQKPTRFNGGVDETEWKNAHITALVNEGNKPDKLWTSNLQDLGESKDDATRYWSFRASWSKGGHISNVGGTWTQAGGTFIDGTLRLHFHPHAKPTANYLHIKKSDGSDPKAGAFQNNHWLVKAIGLAAKDLTPDG